jgi:RHS repeat-associated protein
MLWRGSLDEPGNVTFTSALVNGKPARMLSGNVFEATLDMVAGTNTVTVRATDTSGNTATKNYEVDVAATDATYTYDPNGNLTQKTEGTDTWGYEWNALNQLTRITRNSIEQARFSYDPKGRRVEKIAAGVTATYTYDGVDILREARRASTFKYIHGPGIDEPVAREDGSGALNYYHADGLTSIVKRTDQTGAVVHEYRYDAWGNIEIGTGEPGYAFAGREWDPETNLDYYRARYFDPKIGRFASEDPLGFDGDGTSFYVYVGNNPVVFADPSGLWRYHGNWCGPYWTGGQYETYTPAHDLLSPGRKAGTPFYKPPIDPLDYACRTHDICYYTCRQKFPCNKQGRAACMTKCDRELGYDAAAAGHSLGSPLWWWMTHNDSPDPGPDDCKCTKK